MLEITCDTHTHTIYSRHAYSTVMENISASQARGLQVLGMADHFSAMIHGTRDLRDYQYFTNMKVWPRQVGDLTVLRGAEVDILDLDGTLFGDKVPVRETIIGRQFLEPITLGQFIFPKLDYLVASVHNNDFAKGASQAETTQMYLNVLEHDKVFILGHTGRSQVNYDKDEVLLRAKELHKLIEINNFTLSAKKEAVSVCRDIAIRCAELEVPIAVNTDAHIAYEVGDFAAVRTMLEEIHFPQELIASRSKEAYLKEMELALDFKL